MERCATGLKGVVLTGALLLPSIGCASGVTWPELPKDCFVRARPATQADMTRGCAAFVIGKAGTPGSTALDIQIPQYAWHVDQASGKRSPVILIQAEESSGIKAVGYKEVNSPGLGAALLSEMIPLGTGKPGQ